MAALSRTWPNNAPKADIPPSNNRATYVLLGGLVLWVIITYWTFRLLRPTEQALPWIFLDNLNLLIHEAGHWLFMPFGRLMQFAGGSITQVLLPTIFCGYFIWRRDYMGVSFSLFWIGDNVHNVSYYAADAQAMALPLLGGDSSGHDWNNILTMVDALPAAQSIGLALRVLAVICLIAAQITLIASLLQFWQSRFSASKDDGVGDASPTPATTANTTDTSTPAS